MMLKVPLGQNSQTASAVELPAFAMYQPAAQIEKATQAARDFAAKLTKPVQSAIKGADSAAQLTQRLLAFSRRQALEPMRVDLNRLVTDML